MKILLIAMMMLVSLSSFAASEINCTLGLSGEQYVDQIIPTIKTAFSGYIENDKIRAKVSGYKTENEDGAYELEVELFDSELNSTTTVDNLHLSKKNPTFTFSKMDGKNFRRTMLACHLNS